MGQRWVERVTVVTAVLATLFWGRYWSGGTESTWWLALFTTGVFVVMFSEQFLARLFAKHTSIGGQSVAVIVCRSGNQLLSTGEPAFLPKVIVSDQEVDSLFEAIRSEIGFKRMTHEHVVRIVQRSAREKIVLLAVPPAEINTIGGGQYRFCREEVSKLSSDARTYIEAIDFTSRDSRESRLFEASQGKVNRKVAVGRDVNLRIIS